MWCGPVTEAPTMTTEVPSTKKVLTSKGAQDAALTENPEFTFWKNDYHQHYAFGKETKEYHLQSSRDGSVTPCFGHTHTLRIPVDDADLLGPLTLQITLPALLQTVQTSTYTKWAYGGVLSLVEKIEFVANGAILQQFSNRVMDIESNMVTTSEHKRGFDMMTGRNKQSDGLQETTYYLPMPFWFCRTKGNALPYFPLCALSREVLLELRLTMKPLIQCVNANRTFLDLKEADILLGSVKMAVLAETVLLHPEERVLYTNRKDRHYLIEEFQEQEDAFEPGVSNMSTELTFSRNIKRLHWVLQDVADTVPNTVFGNNTLKYDGYSQLFLEGNYNSENAVMYPPPIRTCQLLFSNNPREPLAPTESSWEVSAEKVDSMFYTKVQPLLYEGCNSFLPNYIFGYFFSLHPFEYSPSGSYNMSATTNHLHMTLVPSDNRGFSGLRRTTLFIYSVGYNILKISTDGEPVVMFID